MSSYDEQPRGEHDAPTAAVPPARPTRSTRSGWHPVNTGHLVMGVAFVGLVAVWALVASDTVRLADAGWILSLPWLAAGAAGLIATVLRGRRHPDEHDLDHDGPGSRMHGWQ